MNTAQVLASKFRLDLGGLTVLPTYWQAGAIVLLVFLLILTLAQVRRHFLDWTAKGAIIGVFFGFLLALIMEGFLIIGGKTALTELLGWKNAPKPIVNALDLGRDKLVNVLGVTSDIPVSNAEGTSVEKIIEDLQSLPPADNKRARFLICAP